jgi:hypothetical protein
MPSTRKALLDAVKPASFIYGRECVKLWRSQRAHRRVQFQENQSCIIWIREAGTLLYQLFYS